MGFDETQKEHDRKNKGADLLFWEDFKTALKHVLELNKYSLKLSDKDVLVIKEHVKTLETAIKLENGED